MTNEQIRIAVAKASGWHFVDTPAGIYMEHPDHPSCEDGRVLWEIEELPNWPSDLNACAEFEKTLKDDEKTDYIRLLNKGDFSYRRLAFATALQRCEAFLRTIGQWEEPAPGAKEEGV